METKAAQKQTEILISPITTHGYLVIFKATIHPKGILKKAGAKNAMAKIPQLFLKFTKRRLPFEKRTNSRFFRYWKNLLSSQIQNFFPTNVKTTLPKTPPIVKGKNKLQPDKPKPKPSGMAKSILTIDKRETNIHGHIWQN